MNIKKTIAAALTTTVLAGTLAGCSVAAHEESVNAMDRATAAVEWDQDTTTDTPFHANTVIQMTPQLKEVLWDESQRTHWQNGGLIVGNYGHALAACQDGRFTPRQDFKECVRGAYEWAKDTGQKTKGVGPITLPKEPVKKPVKRA